MGRGPLAGPLTVAAVVLPPQPVIVGLDDSKKLSPKRREELALQIMEQASAFGVAHIEPAEIDACGMAASLRVCMTRALRACGVEPDCVLLDGNPMNIHPREKNIVKGDGKAACIAAAVVFHRAVGRYPCQSVSFALHAGKVILPALLNARRRKAQLILQLAFLQACEVFV